MLRKLVLATIAITLAATSSGFADNERGKRKLEKLLKPHIAVNRSIGADVRTAAGDRTMAIFDRRSGRGGRFSQCSFFTYRGKRALTCNEGSSVVRTESPPS